MSSARARTIAREVSVFAFFLVLTVALTWPYVANLATALPDQGDPLLNTWILSWVCHALTHAPFDLYNAPMYFPGRFPLAYSENMIGIALPMLPFHLAGASPITLYNLAQILGFAFSGYAAYVLGRSVSGSVWAGLIAGVFYAYTGFKWMHLSHLQVIWSGWLPLLLAALIAYWQRPSRWLAVAFYAAFVMNGLTNIYFLLFGGFAAVITLAIFATLYPQRGRAFWQPLLISIVAACLTLVPFLLPYVIVSRLYDMHRNLAEVTGSSATWSDWVNSTPRSWLYSRFQQNPVRAELELFPGLLALVLSAAALVRIRGLTPNQYVPIRGQTRYSYVLDALLVVLAVLTWIRLVSEGSRAAIPITLFVVVAFVRLTLRFPNALEHSRFSPAVWASLIWITVGVLGAFGTNGFLHPFLYRLVPAFRSLRAAGRWAILVYVGLAALSAIGAKGRRNIVAALLLALAIVEAVPRLRPDYVVVEKRPVHQWLKEQSIAPFVALPLVNQWGIHFQHLLYQTEHWLPMLNGTSGFEPELHYELRTAMAELRMDDAFTRKIESTGCKLVIVHPDGLAQLRGLTFQWLDREMKLGRIAYLRRFDGGISGDYVFAFTKNLPGWQRLKGTGRDEESLRRLFRNESVYSGTTVARLEVPARDATYEGELHFSGWAVSPHGIRSATFLLHGGKVRIPAQGFGRPDVEAMLPWYPKTKDKGFVAEVHSRPRGIPRETMVQVEIVDGAGRVTMLPTVFFTWR